MAINRPSEATITEMLREIVPSMTLERVEPVDEGVSTFVYRLMCAGEILYLRVLPELGANFTPEAAAHRLARDLEVRVPEVLFSVDHHPLVGRSVMITTTVPGAAISQARLSSETLRSIVIEAGRDLARLNQIPVDGFGWIRRDPLTSERLQGMYSAEHDFLAAMLDESLPSLDRLGFSRDETRRLEIVAGRLVDAADAQHAWLAHGDFDASHIFQHHGRYSGIIDFGEIRGANRWYDLAHFRLHDGELLPDRLLPWLLEGYREVMPLPANLERRLQTGSLLIALWALARSVARGSPVQADYRERLRNAIRRDLPALMKLSARETY